MILIISSLDDRSTNDVIDWLRYYNVKFLRVSSDDKLHFKSIWVNVDSEDFEFYHNDRKYLLSDFKSVWYRRSMIRLEQFIADLNGNETESSVNNQLRTEHSDILNHFIYQIEKKSINSPKDLHISKIKVLSNAQKVGLLIPKTIVTTKKSELQKMFDESPNGLITKSIAQGTFIYKDNQTLNTLTKEVTQGIIDSLKDTFFPSLFQSKIDKAFELRIFFINNMSFASTIFSQNDDQTKLDFRDYNQENPNRTPPYKLPNEIQKKLELLMNEIRLNCGSIDMIVTKTGKYIFLEVNPIGQFSQVSTPCNYALEKVIANELMNYGN